MDIPVEILGPTPPVSQPVCSKACLDGGWGPGWERLPQAWGCCLQICCVDVCLQDVCKSMALPAGGCGHRSAHVTHAYTCTCIHVVPKLQALQSLQGHFLFRLSTPLPGQACLSLSPTQNTVWSGCYVQNPRVWPEHCGGKLPSEGPGGSHTTRPPVLLSAVH